MSLLYDFRICSEIKVNCSNDIRAIPRSRGGRDGAGGEGGGRNFYKIPFHRFKVGHYLPHPLPCTQGPVVRKYHAIGFTSRFTSLKIGCPLTFWAHVVEFPWSVLH